LVSPELNHQDRPDLSFPSDLSFPHHNDDEEEKGKETQDRNKAHQDANPQDITPLDTSSPPDPSYCSEEEAEVLASIIAGVGAPSSSKSKDGHEKVVAVATTPGRRNTAPCRHVTPELATNEADRTDQRRQAPNPNRYSIPPPLDPYRQGFPQYRPSPYTYAQGRPAYVYSHQPPSPYYQAYPYYYGYPTPSWGSPDSVFYPNTNYYHHGVQVKYGEGHQTQITANTKTEEPSSPLQQSKKRKAQDEPEEAQTITDQTAHLKFIPKKGLWSPEEDEILFRAMQKMEGLHARTRFWSNLAKELARRLPGRSGKQIRERWINHLDPTVRHGPFSHDEELLLWQGHTEYGNKWRDIAKKFFDLKRTDNSIKNRFRTSGFKQFVLNKFGPEAYASMTKKLPNV